MKRSCDSESHRSANFNFTKLVPAYTLNLHGIVCSRLSDPRIQVVGHAHLTHLGFPTKRSEKNWNSVLNKAKGFGMVKNCSN